MILLPETSRSLVGNGSWAANRGVFQLYSRYNGNDPTKNTATSAKERLVSIWELLTTPVMLLLATSGAFLFAALYAVTVTMGRYLQEYHSFNVRDIGLAYLAVGTQPVLMILDACD